jgi:hypothetical protein
MIARRGSGWLTSTLLLGVCIALASVVYGQLRMTPPKPAPGGGDGEAPALAALPAQPRYTLAPAEDFSEVLERPLFSPTRRPPAEGTVAAPDSEPTLEVTLMGIIISSEEQIAIVKPKGGGGFLRLSVGDSFQGWAVESIEPNRIIFRRGDIEEHIELTYDLPPPVQKPKRRKRKQRNQRSQEPNQVQPETRQN